MSEPINLMFDTETLGSNERAVVTTIAVIPFSFDQPATFESLLASGFYAKMDGLHQIKKYKREIDDQTVAWWKKQPKEARQRSILPSPDDEKMEDVCDNLRAWIKGTGYSFKEGWAWARGPHFDFPKIESMYRDLGQFQPINGFAIRDVRTAIDVLTGSLNGMYGLNEGTPKGFIKHHALHDAALDVLRLKEIHDSLLEQ